EKMSSSDDGTNFVINTCEWPNGPHTLFATVTASSGVPGPSGFYPIDIGRAVSSYVPVTFDNYISRLAFSQPFFEPELGQTQTVTAAFANYSGWTLQVLDESSNAVKTVTGVGSSLHYDWDGTGDGGTNLEKGIYYYLLSAYQTNAPSAPLITNSPVNGPP